MISNLPLGVIRSAAASDAKAMLEIYRPYVEDSAVSYEFRLPGEAEFQERIADVQKTSVWLVYEHLGKAIGYAYGSKHRAREAYQWSVEVSAYVAADFHRTGVARALYQRLLSDLKELGYCTALAGISLPNVASIAFHESQGFSYIGTYKKIGFKLGQWRDAGWWQKFLQDEGYTPKPLKKPL